MNADHIAPRTGAARPGPAIEPLLSLDDLVLILGCSRRKVETMKSSGKLPAPDLSVGRLPRWRPETVRAWIDAQARGRGVGR